MRILEYTLGLPPFRRGGLPRYSTDLSEELAKNNEVYLMYPGSINPYSKKIKLSKRKNDYSFTTVEMKNPLPVSLGLGIRDERYYMEQRDISALKKFVKQVIPDVVHFHTLMGIPKEFLEYLHDNKIKMIYTTHDFYGLCPKMLDEDPRKKLASPKCSYDCMLCNIGPSYKKIVIMQSHVYERLKESKIIKKMRSKTKNRIFCENKDIILDKDQIELRYQLRKYYLDMFNLIDIFHFNSTVSKKYFQTFIPHLRGKVIPITHGNLNDNRSKKRIFQVNHPINLGYIGPYDNKKGFFLYTQILQELEKKYEFKAHFYGDVVERKIFNNKNFINHGVVSSKELNKEISKLDIVVVPSLWHETFGYVVLESLLEGVPCIVSNTVGAKDLVPSDWVFKNKKELSTKLTAILANPDKVITKMNKRVIELSIIYNLVDHTSYIKKYLYLNDK